jgi:hypothetical protein
VDRPRLGRAVVREAGKHGRGGGEGEAQSGAPTVTQSSIRVTYLCTLFGIVLSCPPNGVCLVINPFFRVLLYIFVCVCFFILTSQDNLSKTPIKS